MCIIVVLKRLSGMFGEAVRDRTIISMVRTRWLADPLFKGSYSFPAIGEFAKWYNIERI